MPSVQYTANFPQLTTLRGIHMVIFHAWQQRSRVGRGIFNVYESRQLREHTQTVGGVGIMETKNEGQAIDYDALNEGFQQTYTHLDYAKGMRASRNQMRDELYGTMEKQGQELGYSGVATEETILSNHFNNGFTSTVTGPDSVSLFNTAHVRENGSTFRNKPSTDVDLHETSLQQGFIDFRDQRDGGGKRLLIRPETLLIAPANQFVAQQLTKSTHAPEDDTNAINYISQLGVSCVVWDYLTDSDAWFLLASKSNHNLNMYTREEFWTEHIYDFDTKDYKISGMFAQSSAWGDSKGTYGSSGG